MLPSLLGHRLATFAAVFEQLEAKKRPLTIVETGCLRVVDNWSGDGQSTLLFDRLVNKVGGWVFSVDISPQSVAVARSVVSEKVTLTCADSVKYLRDFVRPIDLLYLDSFDFDVNEPMSSATHHLYELTSAIENLRAGSIVLVDDMARRYGKFFGKGMMVADYMDKIGVPIMVEGETQVAWMM